MLAVMHSHFWDGEGGGGGQPTRSAVSAYAAFQIVILRASIAIAIVLVV